MGPLRWGVPCQSASKPCSFMQEFFQTYYSMGLEKIVAIGDYYVDMDMIRNTGLSIAMGNVPEEVKQAAKRVTTSCEEDRVYLALKSAWFTPSDAGQRDRCVPL